MNKLPRISIVTPSFNQGGYLQETIESVLSQNYPNLEYIIIDGGSTDESVEVIRSFSDRLAFWVSERDRGQSDALHKGFQMATGDYLTWLNSDDVLLPHALESVRLYLEMHPDVEWLSSRRPVWMDAQGGILRVGRLPEFSAWIARLGSLAVGGPSTFFAADLYRRSRGLRIDLMYTMDTELWWQFFSLGACCHLIDNPLMGFRWHAQAKTSGHVYENDPKRAAALREQVASDQRAVAQAYGVPTSKLAGVLHRVRQTVNGNYARAYVETRALAGRPWQVAFADDRIAIRGAP